VIDIQVNEKPKADRIANRIKVTYSTDAPESAPKNLIFKHGANGRFSAKEPKYCAGVREGIFYGEIAPAMLNPPSAFCYDVGIDYDGGQSYMLLEDISETHYLVPASDNRSPYGGWKSFDNLSGDTFRQVVEPLVHFQAFWWEHSRINEPGFLQSTGDMLGMIDTSSEEWANRIIRDPNWADNLARNLEKHRDPSPLKSVALTEKVIAGWPALYRRRIVGNHALTFIHVDFHLRNVLLPKDRTKHHSVIFDWEGLTRGIGVSDVAHLLATSMLPPSQWRQLEDILLPLYHNQLCTCGVQEYSLADCRDDYRLSLVALVPQAKDGGPFLRSVLSAFDAWNCEALF
jgi:hypothetical protein